METAPAVTPAPQPITSTVAAWAGTSVGPVRYAEVDLGHTAQTWALILDRLAKYLATGTPQPFFPAEPS